MYKYLRSYRSRLRFIFLKWNHILRRTTNIPLTNLEKEAVEKIDNMLISRDFDTIKNIKLRYPITHYQFLKVLDKHYKKECIGTNFEETYISGILCTFLTKMALTAPIWTYTICTSIPALMFGLVFVGGWNDIRRTKKLYGKVKSDLY